MAVAAARAPDRAARAGGGRAQAALQEPVQLREQGGPADRPGAAGGADDDVRFTVRLLEYLETQYLRRALVPVHPHLKFVGQLPPIDAPHHPRINEWTRSREGVRLGDLQTLCATLKINLLEEGGPIAQRRPSVPCPNRARPVCWRRLLPTC